MEVPFASYFFLPTPLLLGCSCTLHRHAQRETPQKARRRTKERSKKQERREKREGDSNNQKRNYAHRVCPHAFPPLLSPFLSFEWGGACCPSPSVKCQAATVASVKRKKGGYEHNGELQKGFLRK
jgi:hypothetical protein